MKTFALIGVGGYIAPRHLKAIKETGGRLVAALDKHDSVGVLDSYFPEADFFVEFERFDRHLEKRRRAGQGVDYVSICSPNYLHDAHARFALRIGADAICEKPLALNPWNVTALAEAEAETGRRINVILQLRLHPALVALKDAVAQQPQKHTFDVELTYITSRGRWYCESWKGDVSKSGGIATNIGVHFFDALLWLFGMPRQSVVQLHDAKRASGMLELDRARVRWFLSIDKQDLSIVAPGSSKPTYRSVTVDGQSIDFSEGFADLHDESYRRILAGAGFRPTDVLPSIALVSSIRRSPVADIDDQCHPLLLRASVHRHDSDPDVDAVLADPVWSGRH